jgi:hypothetical protein
MKNVVLTILLIAGSYYSQAQTPGFIGHWKFSAVYEAEEMDSTSKEMVALFFKDLAFVFNEDKTCSLQMMGKLEAAKWKLKDTKTNSIEVQPEKGKAAIIKTISQTEDEWIIGFATGNFVLVRVKE